MAVAKIYQDELETLKNIVQETHEYFKPNYDRFDEFIKFVFKTTLTDNDKAVLTSLDKPQVEFPVLPAYISRLCGEFSKQEPSVEVTPDDGAPVDEKTIEVVEGHFRHIMDDAKSVGTQYHTYRHALSGGYSVIKVFTEYANSMSFKQVIKVRKAQYPTLCGFDSLAKTPSKCDGRYCFEIFPKRKDEFLEENPKADISNIRFTRGMQGFNWSFANDKADILLICDFYEKKKKRTQIVELADNQVMTRDGYKEFLIEWEKSGRIEQPPAIKGKPRWTFIETICRYRFIENQVLEYVETDYNYLPLIFVDGDSIDIAETPGGLIRQMTRPYVYHARDAQRLKNFSGQTITNDQENMVQHKFKVAKESIPEEAQYRAAYEDVQHADTLVYNAFKDNDPNVPVPPPIEIQRVPTPVEVINTFSMMDQLIQTILGSYDSALGINDNQLSGIAIVEGATQSNSAAMPFVVNYLEAWNQVALLVLDLIPKYYNTPRTIPIIAKDGKKSFIKINQNEGVDLNYDANALQIKVTAGANFAIQKDKALNKIIMMMKASPVFAEFMNAKGLIVLLNNLDVHGNDVLKKLAEEFMQELKQRQEQQMQMQQQEQQNNPALLKVQNERMKIQADAQQNQVTNQIKVAQVAVTKQEADNDRLKIMAEMQEDKEKRMVQLEQDQTRRAAEAVDVALKVADMSHRHVKETHELNHLLTNKKDI